MRTCSILGCDRKHEAKGLCHTHYMQTRKRGEPKLHPFVCGHCGHEGMKPKTNAAVRYCDDLCKGAAYSERMTKFVRLPSDHPVVVLTREASRLEYSRRRRGPLRRAIEDLDWTVIATILQESTVETSSGCWEWQRSFDRNGYPKLQVGQKHMMPHRLMAEANRKAALQGQPVHHQCANRACINPAHLQPISQRENVAEMLQRNHYIDRILALEAALVVADPAHPLLAA